MSEKTSYPNRTKILELFGQLIETGFEGLDCQDKGSISQRHWVGSLSSLLTQFHSVLDDQRTEDLEKRLKALEERNKK